MTTLPEISTKHDYPMFNYYNYWQMQELWVTVKNYGQ